MSSYNQTVMVKKKFATKLEEDVLRELRLYAEDSKRGISDIVNEAVEQHLRVVRVRPLFRNAATAVLDKHEKLLKRLAR